MAILFKLRLVLVLMLPSVLGQLDPMNIGAQCSCPIRHPQEKICRADLVIQGRVIEMKSSDPDHYGIGALLEYTVKVTKVYKGQEPVIQRGKRIRMITSSSPGKCGVTEMETGETYILTGLELEGEIFFSQCEWVQRFKDLTPDQRRGLKSEYNDGCGSCLIEQEENSMPGIHDNPSRTGNICYHDPLGSANLLIEDCESMFAVCLQADDGNQCDWSHSKRYGKCVAKRLKRYSAQQGVQMSKNTGHRRPK